MNERKVSIINDSGEKLIGIETTPDNLEDKLPVVILAHGFGVTKEEYDLFVDAASRFAEQGMISYRFDFSGCGESEGDYGRTTLTKLSGDLHSIFDYVNNQESVDSNRIGIWAQSFGTSTTVAAQLPVKALVFTGSLAHPHELFSKSFNEYNPHGISTRIKSDGRVLRFQPEFWKDFKNYDLVELAAQIRCPVLFVHGTEDTTTPLSETEALYEAVPGEKKLEHIKGADHGLNPNREEAYHIIATYFTNNL